MALELSARTDTLPRRPGDHDDIVVVTSKDARRVLLRRGEEGSAKLAPLPLMGNLLQHTTALPFGNDARCIVKRGEGSLSLHCRPGTSISGVTLSFTGHRLPQGAALDVRVLSKGDAAFAAEVTAVGADAKAPQPIVGSRTTLPLPMLGPEVEPQLVVFAPKRGGTLTLDALEIAAPPAKKREAEVAAWAWSPDLWRDDPAVLIEVARAKGVRRLFVTLDVAAGKLRNVSALRDFVRRARSAGIAVEAVEGDPRMVQEEGLSTALARARLYADYQRGSRESEKLAGIQYDIEPYSLADWSGDASDWRRWSGSIVRLSQAAREPVDLVLPFWTAATEEGVRFLAAVSGSIRSLSVMSYRTDPAELTQIAEPLLAWGSKVGKPVRLALEAGPLPDEIEDVYRPAVTGTLALINGPEPRVQHLERDGTLAGARMYRLSQRSVIRGARLSFLGREEAMTAMATRSSVVFAAWPTYTGFALHGLDWTISEEPPVVVR